MTRFERFAAFGTIAVILVLGGLFLFGFWERTVVVQPGGAADEYEQVSVRDLPLPPEPEAPTSTNSVLSVNGPPAGEAGTPKQKPLAEPPAAVKAIYLTSWTAGSASRVNALIDFVDRDLELNAVVIDIKDYSGYLAYRSDVPEAKASGAESQLRIGDVNALLKKLHDKSIYAIGRISVFQDPVLAKHRPDLALGVKGTAKPWTDRKGLMWLDAAAQEVWDYNLAIARDALERGFDEVNFDYIRFPSDGNLEIIYYPLWDEVEPRHKVIRRFFKYLRDNLAGAKISADLFGLATVATDDLGIGQVIEDAYAYFDFVAPMVYPSHYASGFIGYGNPAEYPYEVVKHSLENAVRKREALIMANSEGQMVTSSSVPLASNSLPVGKLRPWLQVFDLGATYNRLMVEAQIRATEEVLKNATTSDAWAGWMLWDPKNTYVGYKN